MCLVEIEGPRPGLVTSCSYPAENGLVVRTDTNWVKRVRRVVVALLLAHCPSSKVIRNLA
ncbi:MAG: 2Fe-2S iron-sulfur cluster-binding protein [Anaerolineae bacterium]